MKQSRAIDTYVHLENLTNRQVVQEINFACRNSKLSACSESCSFTLSPRKPFPFFLRNPGRCHRWLSAPAAGPGVDVIFLKGLASSTVPPFPVPCSLRPEDTNSLFQEASPRAHPPGGLPVLLSVGVQTLAVPWLPPFPQSLI